MKQSILLITIALMVGTISCQEPESPQGLPACLERYVEEHQSISVNKGQYKGEAYYVVNPDCCDMFVELLNDRCEYICAPSGGFTGSGDGTCPAWVQDWEATEEVWRRE